jgi:hypothetical protein
MITADNQSAEQAMKAFLFTDRTKDRIGNRLRASKLIALAVLFLMALPHSGKGEAEYFNYKLDEKKLLSGEIQVFEKEYQTEGKGIKKRVVGVMILKAPLDKVWQVLEDWDAMGKFVPNLEYNKTIYVFEPPGSKDKIGNSLIEGQLKVLYLSINYTLNVKFDNTNCRQEWKFVTDEQVENYNKKNIPVKKATGGLKNIEGFEYVEPYGDGSSTIYYYAPIVETSIPLPEFIEKALSKNTLNGYMEGIRKMVNSYGNK